MSRVCHDYRSLKIMLYTDFYVACLRETLRLSPPAAMRAVEALEDLTIGNGKYFLPKGSRIAISTRKAQCDPKVWGEDVSIFTLHVWCTVLTLFAVL